MNPGFLSAQLFRTISILATALLCLHTATAKDLAPYSHDYFFSPAHLVKIDIKIEKADWDALRFQHRSLLKTLRTDVPPTKQEKQFDYFPAQLKIDGVDVGKVAIRKKGFIGSMDDNRPSFKIKLDRYDKKKSFADLDTLTLNNNKQDPSDLNQVIGYQLFRSAGLPASKCNFSLVTLNGKNMGIYCNLESPDKRFLKRQLGTDKGALYEGTIADFFAGGLIRFERKFGKKKHDEKLHEIAEALEEEDDDEMMKKLGKVLDLDEFYRYWAMECLLGHWDGYVSNRNNYFVYYNPDRKRIVLLPWGMDQLAEDHNMFWGEGFRAPKSVKADGVISRRLYQTEEGKERYFEALNGLLNSVWNEAELTEQVNQLEKLIAPHREHTPNRWRQTGKPMAEFVAERRAQLEAEMAGDYPEWTLGLRELPGRVEKRGECRIEFSFSMVDPETAQGKFVDATGSATVSLTANEEEIDFSKPTITIRKNEGRSRYGGETYSFQFSTKADDPEAPTTIEVSFPVGRIPAGYPIRVDVFASPGNGRLLSRSGNVAEDGTIGSMTGVLKLKEFGGKEGDPIAGQLTGEFYQFVR